MAEYNKTRTQLQALEAVAADDFQISDEIDVSNALSAYVFVNFAPDSETSPTDGTEFEIEVSDDDSSPYQWRPVARYQSQTAAAVIDTFDAQIAASSSVISEGTTTGLSVKTTPRLFLKNAGALANSLFRKLVAVTTNVSFELADATGANTFETDDHWCTEAEHWIRFVNLAGATRLRVTCNNNRGTTNRPIIWQVVIITATDISEPPP